MTLPDTIGGHSRRQWISTMHDIENVPDMIAIAEDAYARANGDVRIAPHSARVVALHDPAKLAELLAEALRERGVLIVENGDDPGDDMRFPAAEVFVENGCVGMHLYRTWKDCENEPSYTDRPLPMTRAALLRILELPEGATAADAMKALEVGK